MNREDILNNKFEFVSYEKYIDLDHVNRFILRIPKDKFSFFKRLFKSENKECFILKDNIFYVFDGIKSYAFKLDDDFKSFADKMLEKKIPVFNISFSFPQNDIVYDFIFIGEVWNIILNGNHPLLYSSHNSRLTLPEHL